MTTPEQIEAAKKRLLTEPTVNSEDAAALLGISPQAARIAQRKHELDGYRIGRSIRFLSAPIIERLGLAKETP